MKQWKLKCNQFFSEVNAPEPEITIPCHATVLIINSSLPFVFNRCNFWMKNLAFKISLDCNPSCDLDAELEGCWKNPNKIKPTNYQNKNTVKITHTKKKRKKEKNPQKSLEYCLTLLKFVSQDWNSAWTWIHPHSPATWLLQFLVVCLPSAATSNCNMDRASLHSPARDIWLHRVSRGAVSTDILKSPQNKCKPDPTHMK